MEIQCAYCGRSNGAATCSRCGTPYCNPDCQANDWGFHKKFCCTSFKPTRDVPFKDLSLSDFEIIRQIGEGNFTVIKKVEHKSTGKVFALKLVDRVKMTRMHKEGDVLAEKHNLLKLSGCHSVVRIFSTFKEPSLLFILQEYIPGKELWAHCQYFGLCSDLLSRYYMYRILQGVMEMHRRNVVHRDIKPENVIVCNCGNDVKFVDLGSSDDLETPGVRPKIGAELKGRVYEHFVGTPQYMAPECANNRGSGKPSDVWSSACVWYHLYAGWSPFMAATDYLVFQKSLSGKVAYPETMPASVRELISHMLQQSPEARPNVETVLGSAVFDPVRGLWASPLLSLADSALVSLKDYYVENQAVLKVRSENYDKAKKEVDAAISLAEKMLTGERLAMLKKTLGLFKAQLRSVFTDEEFNLAWCS